MVQQIEAPLREDVRLLGNLLGETLKLHAGKICLIRSSKFGPYRKVLAMDRLKQKTAGTIIPDFRRS